MPHRLTRPHAPLPRLLSLLLLTSLLCPPLVAQDTGAQRDLWQQPQEVMDALGIHAGSVVADVGAGEGYFTFHLAARVGPQGKVYAEDIDAAALAKIRRRAARKHLEQIETILGAPDDPRLPAETLDAILVVNAYHEFREYDAMLQGLYRALKPGGQLAIIDGADDPGQPRSVYYRRHRMPAEVVREDAARAGFRFLRELPGFTRPRDHRPFYFLIFEKPPAQTRMSAPSEGRADDLPATKPLASSPLPKNKLQEGLTVTK